MTFRFKFTKFCEAFRFFRTCCGFNVIRAARFARAAIHFNATVEVSK